MDVVWWWKEVAKEHVSSKLQVCRFPQASFTPSDTVLFSRVEHQISEVFAKPIYRIFFVDIDIMLGCGVVGKVAKKYAILQISLNDISSNDTIFLSYRESNR